ncbi:MAG TPA: cupin domain-containing protein [Xanthobacteraceae bacterium]|nr:cupin domain-containing protein [Xanthobacteraceae bacterium]
MIKTLVTAALLAGVLPTVALAQDHHVVAPADSLKWSAAPPALPKGAQIAVVSGDPSKEGLYVLRLKVPAGYKVPPHMHPQDENVTVISGTFNIAMGEKFDDSKGPNLKAGGFAKAPKGMAHFAWFPEDTVIQIHGLGPSGITYINPADDPRKQN